MYGQPSLSLDDHSWPLLATPRDQEHRPRPGVGSVSSLPFILLTHVLTQSTAGAWRSVQGSHSDMVTSPGRKRASVGMGSWASEKLGGCVSL